MKHALPENLKQGEEARLFPVLATTSKEGRTTAVVLACLGFVREFGARLLGDIGQRVGARALVTCYTEVVFQNQPNGLKERPDGLIVVKVGSRTWQALVEAKVGRAELQADQIERYRALARDNGVDCVITVSNQFATTPGQHPLDEIRKSRSKVPVFHWSWTHILTTADLLINNEEVADLDQHYLLRELHRFLMHESAGVQGFDRMPAEWTDLNRLVSSGGSIPARSKEAEIVVAAWHQETRDLSLILSRKTETPVCEKLSRKHLNDPTLRLKEDTALLRDQKQLRSRVEIPGAAAPIEIVADLMRRSVDVGMTLRAPDDRKTTKARVNWLLRQLADEPTEDLHLRLLWPGASAPTQHSVKELIENVSACDEGKEHLTAHGFHIFYSRRLGARFTQQSNFIADLEKIVPEFYGKVGSTIRAWQKPAPRLKADPVAEEADLALAQPDPEDGGT